VDVLHLSSRLNCVCKVTQTLQKSYYTIPLTTAFSASFLISSKIATPPTFAYLLSDQTSNLKDLILCQKKSNLLTY
ncbi:MAG: hypothetical protein ACI9WV_002265, partial [Patiriisocius sp.]